MIEVGQPAPDFTLPGIQNGEKRDYTLSEYRGKNVILAFYPGDFTPGCTKQMCSYRDNLDELDATGAVLLGISPQDVDSHEKWAEKKSFTTNLSKVCEGDGREACKEVGLKSMTPAKESAYAAVVADYSK